MAGFRSWASASATRYSPAPSEGATTSSSSGIAAATIPVKDLATGRVHITAQNHGYAVDPDSLPSELEVSHLNLNDGTVEGLRHRSLPIISIQYHSEAAPGPRDNEYLFDRFLEIIGEFSGERRRAS